MEQSFFESPLGRLALSATSNGIARIAFRDETMPQGQASRSRNAHLVKLEEELELYFAGKLKRFASKLDPSGTPFQLSVWSALASIPYGQTVSYGRIATQIGNPKASRAVGGANNQNPISIVVPCHRVIGATDTLVGYGGGLWRKEWLLEHEGIALPLG